LVVREAQYLLNYRQNIGFLDRRFDIWFLIFSRHFLTNFGDQGELLNRLKGLLRGEHVQKKLNSSTLQTKVGIILENLHFLTFHIARNLPLILDGPRFPSTLYSRFGATADSPGKTSSPFLRLSLSYQKPTWLGCLLLTRGRRGSCGASLPQFLEFFSYGGIQQISHVSPVDFQMLL
jgi:hypothetical protein